MLKNYFSVSWRNLLKYKVFSSINLFGLALAMSVCLLIILMLTDQSRYDRFHEKQNRIYRILSYAEGSRQPYATSPLPLASSLKEEYPIIEETTTLTPAVGGDAIYNNKIAEMRGYFASPSFFRVFSFQLDQGNASSALSEPNTVVISRELAYQLFGYESPIGKTLEFSDRQLPFPQEIEGLESPSVNWGLFTVTGVIDEAKCKSHLHFDALVSAATLLRLVQEKKIEDRIGDWEWYFKSYTYALLREDKSLSDLQIALSDLVSHKYAGVTSEQVKGFVLMPQPISEIQLGLMANDTNNRMPRIGYYFLAFLALIIMLLACLNYTNLSIARALTRVKEIGIRKVTGASRSALVVQFLCESILTSLLALTLAIGFLRIVALGFKGLWVNQYLQFELPLTVEAVLLFVGFAVAIGLLAGFYPAIHLSSHQPVKVLRGAGNFKVGKMGMRKVLSIVQFVVSLLFITTAILIHNQFQHYMNFDYGFRSANMVNIELQGVNDQQLAIELNKVKGVVSTAASDFIPAIGGNNGIALRKVNNKDEYTSGSVLLTNQNFISTFGLTLLAGKNLSPSGEQAEGEIVVNEATVHSLGFKRADEIIGETLEVKDSQELVRVVGVVKDFRYRMLINQHGIGPLALRNRPGQFKYLTVQLTSSNPLATISEMEGQWKKMDAVHPFKYSFYDSQLAATHQGIFDVVTIIGFIALSTIIIACLGLLGMTIYSAERKTKEVGIRKILGAANENIAYLLSKEFLKMLFVAIVIGAPLSYFFSNMWLQTLPNRVEFGFVTVLISTFILLLFGLLTIVSQTWRAARRNPVESLKID